MISIKRIRNARKVSVRAPEWLAPLLERAFPSAKPAGAGMHWVPAKACTREQLDQLLEMAIAVDRDYPDLDRRLQLARKREHLVLPRQLTPGIDPPPAPRLPRAPDLTPEPGRGEFTLHELAAIQLHLDGIRAIGARLVNLDIEQLQAEILEDQEWAWYRFAAKRGLAKLTTLH